jgi:hypothetical protein
MLQPARSRAPRSAAQYPDSRLRLPALPDRACPYSPPRPPISVPARVWQADQLHQAHRLPAVGRRRQHEAVVGRLGLAQRAARCAGEAVRGPACHVQPGEDVEPRPEVLEAEVGPGSENPDVRSMLESGRSNAAGSEFLAVRRIAAMVALLLILTGTPTSPAFLFKIFRRLPSVWFLVKYKILAGV